MVHVYNSQVLSLQHDLQSKDFEVHQPRYTTWLLQQHQKISRIDRPGNPFDHMQHPLDRIG